MSSSTSYESCFNSMDIFGFSTYITVIPAKQCHFFLFPSFIFSFSCLTAMLVPLIQQQKEVVTEGILVFFSLKGGSVFLQCMRLLCLPLEKRNIGAIFMDFSLHQAESDAYYCFFHFIGQNQLCNSSHCYGCQQMQGESVNYLISVTLMGHKVGSTQGRVGSPPEEMIPQVGT